MLAVALAALLAVPAIAIARDFDNPASPVAAQQFGAPFDANVQRDDTPNDPQYDSSEPDDEDAIPPTTNLFDERFDLFGFPSALTPLAVYHDAARLGRKQVSGFNAAGAWKISRGDPSVQVAILDTGINWDSESGLRTRVALNVDELPAPEPLTPGAPLGGYDLDGNGYVDVDDYKDDPRVGKAAPTGEDLINAFSDDVDDGDNGYVDDIAGWDFFDDDNNPRDASSYFAAKDHGSGRTNEAVEQGNDGAGDIGVCPHCTFVPLRIWDTFVSDQNSFAMAITYATDNGVEVIEGADGGLYHSAFAEAATKYAYEHGVAQLFSGDDLNTANHNYPGAYDHVQLVQGVVTDVEGLGKDLPSQDQDPGIRNQIIALMQAAGAGSNAPVQSYFRNANTTQFGGKSSISMEGPTGSTNTGKAAGAAALVVSAGLAKGVTLTADETREVLEQTAEDVLPENTTGTGVPDPAQTGFDTHFGYGRVNLGAAVDAVDKGRLPPEASIWTPQWYAPVTGATVPITGLARDVRRSGQQFTWKLEYGIGLAPSAWTQVSTGASSGTVTDLGALPLDDIRAALAARTTFEDRDDPAGPVFDKTREDPFKGQFTIRLTVDSGDGAALTGVDRKVLTALDDTTLRPGFPKKLGSGGEAPIRYADLDGDNQQELVVPTEDGHIHAYRPDGSELPGWPVQTQTQFIAAQHPDAPALQTLAAPLEPPRAPTIADLTGDGRPEVITTAGERIYVWDASGQLLPGWPVRPDPTRANCAPSEQLKEFKHPKCGFLATPAIGHLEGPGAPPDIVVPGLDGRLRAYRPDATPVPGFPVRLIDPDAPANEKMTAESINNPAIGDLDGDGRDDVVIPTNEVYGGSGGGGDVSFGSAFAAAGSTSRVYAVKAAGTLAPGGNPFLPGWPIKLGGIIQDVLPLIGPGHDPALVKVGGAQQVVVSTTGGALSLYGVDGTLTRDIQQQGSPGEGALNLFESAAIGDINGANGPDVVKYQVDLGQAANLLLAGQNVPYSHRMGAYDASTGAADPGWPVITDDYQFLSSSTIARVRPGTSQQVLAGTGLGLLHAYDGITGLDAPGFPKVTGGWLFAPAALSDDGRTAGITREGYLFEWQTPGAPACQSEWPSFRHDQQGTGNYDADGTPPAAPENVTLTPKGGDTFTLRFKSPGDDVFCGTATRYVATLNGTALDLGAPVAGGASFTKDITLPGGAGTVVVRAADGPADEVFNLGAPGSATRTAPGGGSGGSGVPGDGGAGAGNGAAGGQGGTGDGQGNGATGTPGAKKAAKETAKLAVARAKVLRGARRLDVLATITKRASGKVNVAFSAAGRIVRFNAAIDDGRIRFSHPISPAQARRGQGIVTLSYPGNADTRSQVVRLRAASESPDLQLAQPQYAGGQRAAIAARAGTLHSYTLFTGYRPRSLRGEMRSFQVQGAP